MSNYYVLLVCSYYVSLKPIIIGFRDTTLNKALT